MAEQSITESLRATLRAAGVDGECAGAIVEGEAEALSEMRSLALVLLDADSIQRTLLASPRPVTVYGASAALREWDEGLASGAEVPGDAGAATTLFAGGGQALLLAPLEGVEQLERALERRFWEAMKASATAAHIAVSPRELVEGPSPHDGAAEDLAALGLSAGRGGFGGCVSRLVFELRRAKGRAARHPYVLEPTSAPRCSETGDRPRAGGRGTLSEFAEHHRRRGQDKRDDLKEARSFDALLKNTKARRLAFVCIDGTAIGHKFAECRTVSAYVELSRALSEAFGVLRDQDFLDELRLGERQHQVMLAGGDDLLFVAPAEGDANRPDALRLAATVTRRIEEQLEAWEIGVGTGVLITTGGLPATLAFEYARALCTSAKRAASNGARSGVDYEVVLAGSPLSQSLTELRKRSRRQASGYPSAGDVNTHIQPTQRPYPLRRFEELLELADKLQSAKIGAAAVGHLERPFLTRDPHTALIDVQYQLARDRRLRDALELSGSGWAREWWVLRELEQERGRVFATALPDIAEVFQLQGRG